MLLRFRFKNYKSFKNLQNFSMAGGQVRKNEERLKKEKDFSILKFSAIFGANGSGKSNFISALNKMRDLLMIGTPNIRLPIYYKLDDKYKDVPTYFETFLFLNNEILSYGFEYNSDKNEFTSEWLVKIDKNKETEIFSRDITKGTFSIDPKIDKLSEKRIKFHLQDFKRKDRLFLKHICFIDNDSMHNNVKELRNVFSWFNYSLRIVGPETTITAPDYFIVDSEIKKLRNLLDAFDTGVKGIKTINSTREEAINEMPTDLLNRIKNDLIIKNKGDKIRILAITENNFWSINYDGNEMSFKKIYFYHDKDKLHPFTMADESDGTQRLIELAEVLLTESNDKFFAIDELDRKFHPQLTRKFVESYLNKADTCDNQLIVSTHESRLLDLDLLRRDEIWFAKKDDNGESIIYSLDEYNVRFDKKVDRAYLDGRYGAIPVFKSVFEFPK